MDGPSTDIPATYAEATRWLYERIDYERVRPDSGQSNPFRLERTERLLSLIGSPQQRIPCVHIAGTKGKGSTAAMLESVLRNSGLRTGLFTSPHIDRVEERMRIDGQPPDEQRFTELVQGLAEVLATECGDQRHRIPTFFESTTLLAWMLFDQSDVDVVVLETGLGGRLDCTNICRPVLTMITTIGLDHTHILGDTIPEIACEKAGILKQGVPVVVGKLCPEALSVIASRARELDCPAYHLGRHFETQSRTPADTSPRPLREEVFQWRAETDCLEHVQLAMAGEHQVNNAALVIQAALLLRDTFAGVSEQSIRTGLQQVSWPLRFEVVRESPTIVLDAAHNPDSCAALLKTLNRSGGSTGRRVLMFGVSADKDAQTMLDLLVPHFDRIVLTRFVGNPRSRDPQELLTMCQRNLSSDPAEVLAIDRPEDALAAVLQLADPFDVIVVTGSLFLAAEVRNLLYSRCQPAELSSRI